MKEGRTEDETKDGEGEAGERSFLPLALNCVSVPPNKSV